MGEFMNNNTKQLRWYNRNFYWACTILITAVILSIYFIFRSDDMFSPSAADTPAILSFLRGLYIAIIGSLTMYNGFTVIFFTLSIFFSLLYIERRIGTLATLLLVLSIIFSVHFTMVQVVDMGADGSYMLSPHILVYSLFGFVVFDFFWSLRKSVRNTPNVAFGLITIFCLYIVNSFVYTLSSIPEFMFYPYELFVLGWGTQLFMLGGIFASIIHIAAIHSQNINYNS